jgi:hypothetical protein
MDVAEKACIVCHQVKSMDDFYISKLKNGRVQLRNQCKICFNEITHEKHRSNPNYKKRKRNRDLKLKYGIDLEIYQNMKDSQNNLCAICESPEERRELNVDHCHSSGKVRQLLCNRCNLLLGRTGDNINLFERCIVYLKTHNQPT